MHRAVAAELDLLDHPSPAAKRQERGGEEAVPFVLGDAEDLERFQDRVQRRDLLVLEPAELLGETAHPAVRRPHRLAVERAEGAIEPLVAAGQLPVRQPLIEKRRAEPDQQLVDKRIGVGPGRLEQQVAMPHRERRRGRERGQVADAVAADPPEGLEREPFPVVVAPDLHRRFAEPVEQLGDARRHARSLGLPRRSARLGSPPLRRSRITQRRVSAIKRLRTADEASSRTRRSAFASATYQTSSAGGPDRSGY